MPQHDAHQTPDELEHGQCLRGRVLRVRHVLLGVDTLHHTAPTVTVQNDDHCAASDEYLVLHTVGAQYKQVKV